MRLCLLKPCKNYFLVWGRWCLECVTFFLQSKDCKFILLTRKMNQRWAVEIVPCFLIFVNSKQEDFQTKFSSLDLCEIFGYFWLCVHRYMFAHTLAKEEPSIR